MADSWVWGFGELGKAMRAKLTDAAGAINLSAFSSVKVQVAASKRAALLLNEDCVPDVNQTTEVAGTNGSVGTGKGCLTFTTNAASALIAAKDAAYLVSFECTDANVPHDFPLRKDSTRTHANLYVRKPLG
jgi:hypothetical protein